MASSRAAAAPFALCILLLASPAVSAALFDDGKSAAKGKGKANSAKWLDMKHVWGATWCLYGGPTAGPFSVRLTTLSAPKTLTARDVIPRNWAPKGTYSSRLNFEASL